MIRIGILTFHRSLNYGAIIQSFSLQRRLSHDFPEAHVEIVDYSVPRVQNKYSSNVLTFVFSSLPEVQRTGVVTVMKATIKNILLLLRNKGFLKKRREMREAFDSVLEQMNLSKEQISTNDCTKASKWIQDRYDVVIVGSDCVWEINNYPFPNLYFLHDVKDVKKLSYAACAQGVLYESLNRQQIQYMGESWRDFAYLGVRDIATESLLKKVDSTLDVRQNCDPTVFLDLKSIPVNMDELRGKFKKAGVDFNRPTVCLMANSDIGKLCRDALGNEYQIVAVYEQNAYADCFVYNLTPFEWAHSFSLFDITVTNRFHGTLLSMKNGIPPITYDCSTSSGYSLDGNTKIRFLYDQLDLVSEHYRVAKRVFTEQDVKQLRDLVKNVQRKEHVALMSRQLKMLESSYNDFSNFLKLAICTLGE